MPDVTIKTGDDLKLLNGTSDVRAVFKTGVITVPDKFALKDCKNLTLDGSTAPKGRVCLTGWPLQILDCTGFTAQHVTFQIFRPRNLTPDKYETWWSSPRFIATKPDSVRDVRLIRCEPRGNTDEIAFWADYVPANGAARVVGRGVTVEDSVFGGSITGLTPGRERHNFGLMLDGVSDVQIRRCLFARNNRRSIQQRGTNCLIEHCYFISYGTMAVGLHVGTSADIRHCTFQPTGMTPGNRPAPIKAVEGTLTAFGAAARREFGTSLIRVRIENCTEQVAGRHKLPKTDWNLWGWNDIDPTTNAPFEDTVQHWGGLPKWYTASPLDLGKVGAQDTLTKALITAVKAGEVPWLGDTPAIPTTDYL